MKVVNSKFFKSLNSKNKMEQRQELILLQLITIFIMKKVIHILLYNHLYNHINICYHDFV